MGASLRFPAHRQFFGFPPPFVFVGLFFPLPVYREWASFTLKSRPCRA